MANPRHQSAEPKAEETDAPVADAPVAEPAAEAPPLTAPTPEAVAPQDLVVPGDQPVKVAGGPQDAPEPEAVAEGVCANCGQPAVWKTTGQGASTVYFCDADRPQEGVERID